MEGNKNCAELAFKAYSAEAKAQDLEAELLTLREALEAEKRRVRELEAKVAEASAQTLDQAAEALAKRPKPSFAEDENGPLASFKRGGELIVMRPERFDSNRMFRERVWRAWLDHNVFPLPSKGAGR